MAVNFIHPAHQQYGFRKCSAHNASHRKCPGVLFKLYRQNGLAFSAVYLLPLSTERTLVAGCRIRIFAAGCDVAMPFELKSQTLFCSWVGLVSRHAGTDDRYARLLQTSGQVQRRLSAELHDHPVRLNVVADVQHILDC